MPAFLAWPPDARISRGVVGSPAMFDLLYLAIGTAFLGLCGLDAAACERL
jgi:hypothetical protein